MILQALTRLYEDLADRGEIARPGWNPAKISFALCLDEQGNLTQIASMLVEKPAGKKTVMAPQERILPAIGTRTVGIRSGFLWDNASYLLGIDEKNPQRAMERFANCKELHHRLLDDISHPVARSILAFLDGWEPEQAQNHPALQEHWDDLCKGGNLLFRVDGVFACEVNELVQAWNRHYNEDGDGEKAQCLITGRYEVPESTHPLIKGVVGAQSSGAAVVSFNAPAFCSYGKEQNLNAPVGKYAAFAYTTALNYLLAKKENVHRVADTTIVCWAEGAEPEYDTYANCFLFGDTPPAEITTDKLYNMVRRLAQGLPCEEMPLDMRRRFYILGLAPNAARLSVRFFYNSTFAELMKNVNAHHQRLEIIGNHFAVMPLWALLQETANLNSKDKAPSSVMAGAMVRAVFSGTLYPASLLEATTMRIHAERDITPGRAAILKAYYLKNKSTNCPEEVLTVSLNESSTNVPYTLGRLFAVYEAVQEAMMIATKSQINTTIRDKYFNSAAATPAMIFPILDDLAQKHLRKLSTGLKISFDKQIGQIKNCLGESNPTRLSLPEQGSFYLGYYHQKQARYTKKEEK